MGLKYSFLFFILFPLKCLDYVVKIWPPYIRLLLPVCYYDYNHFIVIEKQVNGAVRCCCAICVARSPVSYFNGIYVIFLYPSV